jgi:hypothetical protein
MVSTSYRDVQIEHLRVNHLDLDTSTSNLSRKYIKIVQYVHFCVQNVHKALLPKLLYSVGCSDRCDICRASPSRLTHQRVHCSPQCESYRRVCVRTCWVSEHIGPCGKCCWIDTCIKHRLLQLLATCYPDNFTTPNQRDAQRFIGDRQRWRLLDDILTMLRPIRDTIVALEAGDTTLDTAYHYWLVIAAHLHRHTTSGRMSPELREHIIASTNHSWEQLPHDLMATALLLYPHLRDAIPLTIESKENACMFVHNYILQTRQGSPGRDGRLHHAQRTI